MPQNGVPNAWLLSSSIWHRFHVLLLQNPDDGPSKNIYDVLESHKFRPPAGWNGYRPLTSK